MICQACGTNDSRVIDTRPSRVGVGAVRRRYECKNCRMRYSSVEIVMGDQLPKGVHAPDSYEDEAWGSLITIALQRASHNALLYEAGKRRSAGATG